MAIVHGILRAVDEVCTSNLELQTLFGQSENGLVCVAYMALIILETRCEVLILKVLETIVKVSFNHAANQTKLGELDICKLIVRVMERYGLQSAAIMQAALQCVENLANQPIIREFFHHANCSEYVLLALSKLAPQHPTVAEKAFAAVISLVKDHPGNFLQLSNSYSCLLIINTLNTHGEHYLYVAENGLWVIRSIAFTEEVRERLFEYGVDGLVVRLAKFYGDHSLGVAEAALAAMAALAEISPEKLSETSIGGVAGIELIVGTLGKQELDNLEAAVYSCEAIILILEAEGYSCLYRQLDSASQIVDWVLEILLVHGRIDVGMAYRGVTLLFLLLGDDNELWLGLSEKKGMTLLIELIGAHANNKENVLFAEKALSTLYRFTPFPKLCKDLLRCGGIDALVNVLYVHGESSIVVVEEAMDSLLALFVHRTADQINVFNKKACEMAVNILRYYHDKSLKMKPAHKRTEEEEEEESFNILAITRCLQLLRSLSEFIPHCVVLPDFDYFKVLLKLINTQGRTNGTLTGIALESIANVLAEEKNIKRFVKEGGSKILVDVFSEHAGEFLSVAGNGLRIFALLAAKSRVLLGELGVCEVVIDVMVRYVPEFGEAEESIAILGSNAIYNLGLSCAENKAKFLEHDAMVYLLGILKNDKLSVTAKHEIKDAINVIKYQQ